MDMLGGSPEVSLLPDLHILHRDRAVSKRVLIVQRSNPLCTASVMPGLNAGGQTGILSQVPAQRACGLEWQRADG
jgi:hypothetical protein